MFSDELSQLANVVALVLKEVKSVHSSEAKLEQVIVERLLGDSDEASGVFQ